MRMHPIARYRRARGLTQTQVAQRVGVTLNAVQRWEEYGQIPRGETLPAVAQLLGVDAVQLLDELTEWREEKRRSEGSEGKVEAA